MHVRENKKKNDENMNYFGFPKEGIETRFVTIESRDYICTAVDETLGICLFDTETQCRGILANIKQLYSVIHALIQIRCVKLEDDTDMLGVTVNATTSVLDA